MIIKAPHDIPEKNTNLSIFLAGGISNCPDWQENIQNTLFDNFPSKLDIINPRRNNWNMDSQDNESINQIKWEKKYIDYSNMITFWFPKETLCPITLFELGAALHTKNIVTIGIEEGYQRKLDIVTQVQLVNPNIKILFDYQNYVDATIDAVKLKLVEQQY